MKEEKILHTMFGKENHFSVPEGYFDTFAEKIMEQLPDSDARIIEMRAESWWHRMPLRKIAAAMSAIAVLSGGAMLYKNHTPQASMANTLVEHQQTESSDYGTFEQMADYTMLDNQDIYTSLVAEN